MHSEYLTQPKIPVQQCKYERRLLHNLLRRDITWHKDDEFGIRVKDVQEYPNVHTVHLPTDKRSWTFVGVLEWPKTLESPEGRLRYLFYAERLNEEKFSYIFADHFDAAVRQLDSYPNWNEARDLRVWYNSQTQLWTAFMRAGMKTGNTIQVRREFGGGSFWRSHADIGKGVHKQKHEAIRLARARALRI